METTTAGRQTTEETTILSKVARATIDFESRSACSLRKSGSWRYSLDPTTEVLCLGFRLPYWEKSDTELWHPAFPQLGIPESAERLEELFYWILDGGLVEAHNAFFERAIWTNIVLPRHGFPAIPSLQWRDSATKAAAHALPRALDDAGEALHLSIRKDTAGHKLMMKLSKPRKPRKKEREAGVTGLLWWESQELFEQLWAYCRQDVLAEEAVSRVLPDLNPLETQIYLMDQTVNQRGFRLDRAAITSARRLIESETKILNQQLAEVTQGKVTVATQRAKLLKWLEDDQGVVLPNTQKSTLDEYLTAQEGEETVPWLTLTPAAQQALTILRALGQSSTAKYETMQQWINPDDRVRGGLLFHGAATGRWSGQGVQPHNFPKGKIKNMEEVWQVLKQENREAIAEKYGSVMTALSHALRGTIVASPGKLLYVADYAAIEARIVLWLAKDEDALDIFRSGGDIYCEMASEIYQKPINKKDHPDERALGKIAILGLGYQMGVLKFVATAASYGITIDDVMAEEVVSAYRNKFWRVKKMWWDQEEAACEAVSLSGEVILCGRVKWYVHGNFLYCELPSGRCLAYPEPEIRERETPWGEMKAALTFKGVNTLNHKWQRQTTYGGMLVENITQAVARDLMAEAMLRCEQSGIYEPILSVHDEIIAEANKHLGNVSEFEQLVACCPPWATGLPVATEAWRGERYRK